MKNGFYMWNPIPVSEQVSMHHLYLEQVVQVIGGLLFVSGMEDIITVKEALEFGSIGDCVLPTVEFETIIIDKEAKNEQ